MDDTIETKEAKVIPGCTLRPQGNNCQRARLAPLFCARCGWEEDEAARRQTLPIVKDEDKLRRKHVGVSNTREIDQ